MSLLSFAKKIAGNEKPAKAKKDAPKKKAVAKKEAVKEAPAAVSLAAGVIGLTPLITEKGVSMQGANAVVFRVRPETTKGQIMAAVEAQYKVRPVSVRTLKVMGKARRRGKSYGRTPSWKKAYVSLPKGKSIDFSV